ncbi:MAG: outer membrane protein TolC [Planctomycetota bacterium]|jgi:outer membrane protein TolC
MRRKLVSPHLPHTVSKLRFLPLIVAATLTACYTAQGNRAWADRAVYSVLDKANEKVLGEKREFVVERPVDTLRKRLMTSREPVTLTLAQALDIAAENSRDFQRQKESLYLSALSLTTTLNDFRVRFGGGGSATADGTSDTSADVSLTDDLSASASSVVGTQVVTNFVQTFMRSVINGGQFDGSSILNMTITQPLLRGAGRHIAREPLTQSERNVIYAIRDFERFRSQFAIDLVADYWNVVQQMADLSNVDANYNSQTLSRLQVEAFYNAGRVGVIDLGRAKQGEYSANAQQVSSTNRLQSTLDSFKLTLGLPVTSVINLDPAELTKLVSQGVAAVELTEQDAIRLALSRRYDYQTTVDEVEDVGRRVIIADNALNFGLDFTAAISVPAQQGSGLDLDWSKINWSAGVDLNLFLDRIPLRNAYRSQLITFDQTLRAREQAEDQLTASVRRSLRDIKTALDTFQIVAVAVDIAGQRVEAATDLYSAGRAEANDKLDAQSSFLQEQFNYNAAIVAYAIARLQLMNNLEAINLQPQGLRFDMTLPMPTSAAE